MRAPPSLLVGEVEDANDPLGLGRVKVLVRGALDDSLGWLPVRTLGAGPNAGLYAPYAPGDQVAVARLGGAAEAYVVLGGVWSSAMTTPEPNQDGAGTFAGYRGRSAQRVILDSTEKAKLALVAANGTQVLGLGAFAKDGGGDNAVELPRSNLVGDQGIAIAGKQAVVLRAPDGTIEIQGQNVALSALQTHVASAKSAEIEGTQTKLAALGALTLGGSTVGAK